MTSLQRSTVVGIFDAIPPAERAVAALHTAGFTDEQIGFIRRSGETSPGTSPIAGEASAQPGAGLGTGAVIGGLLGAAAALLIPGVGPVLAGGILVHVVGATAVGGAIAGAVGGALAGGLLGALTDMGVPEDEARYADEQFQAGRTIVTVKDARRAGEAAEILHPFGAYDVRSERTGTLTPAMPTPVAATSSGPTVAPVARAASPEKRDEMTRNEPMTEREAGAKEIRVPVTEEKLVPQKHQEETGAVEVRKSVVEEMETIQVPVRREEVHVERVRTDRPLAPGDKPFTDETIRVPVHAEQVTLEKQTRVVGEVVIDKEHYQEQQPVSATVRREEVNVERTGAAGVRPTRPWSEVMPSYRTMWQQRSGMAGGRWDEVEPAYRFGYESSSGSTYQGRSWDQAEVDLRRDWTTRDPRTPWEKVKDSIRAAWDRAHLGT